MGPAHAPQRFRATPTHGLKLRLAARGRTRRPRRTRDPIFAHWRAELGPADLPWISTLITAPAFHHQGLGTRILHAARQELAAHGHPTTYLDCVAGFLPGYYEREGFTRLAAKTISYTPEVTLPMVLLQAPTTKPSG